MRRREKTDERINPLSGMQQFRRLFAFVRPYRGRLAITIVAIVFGSLLGLAGPYTLQFLIDAVFRQSDPALLNEITLVLIFIFASQAVFYFIRAYLLQFVGERVMVDLRERLFEHLQGLSLSFFNERRTGELVSRLTNDVATVRSVVTSDISTALSQVLTFFGALILIIITDWRLTLFMLALVPLVVVIALIFGRRLRKLSSAVQDQLATATTVLEESIGGVRVVQSFARESHEVGRFREAIEHTFALAMKRIKLSALFGPVASFLGFAAVISVFWFGGHEVLANRLTAGQLFHFFYSNMTNSGPSCQVSRLESRAHKRIGAPKRSVVGPATQHERTPARTDAP